MFKNGKPKNLSLVLVWGLLMPLLCSATERKEVLNLVNPWSKYQEFTDFLSTNREKVLAAISYPKTCEPIIDELIQHRMTLVQPTTILPSERELIGYMNENAKCTDFKVDNWVYRMGPIRTLSFKPEGPYYIFPVSLKSSNYIITMPSGIRSSIRPKTPGVVDFEGVTSPTFELWNTKDCTRVGASSAMTSRNQDYSLGIVKSEKYGLLSYTYDTEWSNFSFRIKSVKTEEKKYCAASGIKIGE
jgi:hypothetical protein